MLKQDGLKFAVINAEPWPTAVNQTGRRSCGRQAGDVNEACAGSRRGGGDGASAFRIDGRIRRRIDGGDDAREMDDSVHARERLVQPLRLERRGDDFRAARAGASRSGPDDRPHVDAAGDQLRGEVAADETSGAGDGDRVHAIAFW